VAFHLKIQNDFLDLDGDGVFDLVASCAVTLPSEVIDQHSHIRTNLILISGKTGTVIGRPYLVKSYYHFDPLDHLALSILI